MRSGRFAALAALGLALALSGCSLAGGGGGGGASGSGSEGSGGSGGSGGVVTDGGSTAKVDCSAFQSAVASLFPGGASSPVDAEGTCTWGVGSNAGADAATVGNTLTDIFSLHFDYGDDAETQYQGDDGELTGGGNKLTQISGVGKAASYYDGGTGLPQVSAWSGNVACGSHLFISDAATVGLTTTGGSSQVIAASDTAGVAKKIADICAIAWK